MSAKLTEGFSLPGKKQPFRRVGELMIKRGELFNTPFKLADKLYDKYHISKLFV
jgi:hypothetical protein